MSWRIRICTDGVDVDVDSDSLTLDQVARLEKLAGQPWSLCNPYKSVPAARAFLVVALVRSGGTDEQAEQLLTNLTLRQIKNAFEWVPDEDDGDATEGGDPAPLALAGSRSDVKPDTSKHGSSGKASPRR